MIIINMLEKELKFDEVDRDINFSKMIKNIRKDFKETDGLKNVLTYRNQVFLEKIRKNFKIESNIFNIDEDTEELYNEEFTFKGDGFFIISQIYDLMSRSILLIFYDDEDILKKEVLDKCFSSVQDPGFYNLVKAGGYMFLEECEIFDEGKPELDNDLFHKINQDLEIFFKNKDFYKKNNLAYKRGILLYGPPGNGKTSAVKNILKSHEDKYCIIVDCSKGFDYDYGSFLKKTTKDGKKIIVLEDIDAIGEYDKSAFLNFLDGISSPENMFIIATTNHLDKLDVAITHRPSRFDKVYPIDYPSMECRKRILKKYFKKMDKELLNKCAEKTENFSGAYLKEVFIQSKIENVSPIEAIENIEKQLKLYKNYNGDTGAYLH